MTTDVEQLVCRSPGMSCGHCEAAVKREVGAVAGVARSTSIWRRSSSRFTASDLDHDAIVAAIDEAGYDVV